MRRIVVSLLKGGVAKSETAVSLAHGLALKGHKVLLVDTDVQAQCNDMLGVEPEKGLAELIAGWASPEEALAQARENLWLLAGGVPLAGVKMEIARREMAPEAVLDEILSCYEDQFDVMVMDTAPGWDTLLVNALYCSREVISPVSMEPVALKGLRRFEERLGVIQKYQPALSLKWIVPTFVDGRVKKTAHIMEQLQAEFGDRLTESIRYSVKLSEAPEFGKTIFEHDPRGAGAKGYRALVERVLRDAPVSETFIMPSKIEQAPPPPVTVRPPEPAPQPQEPEPLPEAAVAAQKEVAEPPAPSIEPEPPAPYRQPVIPPQAQPWVVPAAAAAPPLEEPASWEPSPPVMEEAPVVERPEVRAQGLEPPAGEVTQETSASLGAEDFPEETKRPLAARLARQESREPEKVAPKPDRKVWDLRERLKRMPVLSQRLTKGLGSGSR
ncbi:MAG: AAA family ATPase [Desulfarculus sp.]|nr:AAA family ATPase [Pseudomonadota bacterium]MBV1718202.1 AAA family ATPase [Desulfarculus sp.]MBU4575200.1 AAA family ATPase [Pseudomonadota bacterium]MBU4597761.1 AAA family ATPase [Pseudomonadota bacterium]MBV1737974.1 AAA family ATPase [Desulfarculus sp.]